MLRLSNSFINQGQFSGRAFCMPHDHAFETYHFLGAEGFHTKEYLPRKGGPTATMTLGILYQGHFYIYTLYCHSGSQGSVHSLHDVNIPRYKTISAGSTQVSRRTFQGSRCVFWYPPQEGSWVLCLWTNYKEIRLQNLTMDLISASARQARRLHALPWLRAAAQSQSSGSGGTVTSCLKPFVRKNIVTYLFKT